MNDFFEKYDHQIIPEPNSGCWLWLGAQISAGYGHGNRNNVHFYVHRAAYEATHGLGSADGLVVRHDCDTPACCNPDHLLIGTQIDNAMDSVRRGRANRAQGTDCATAALTEMQVIRIRRFARAGLRTAEIKRRMRLGVKWDTIDKAASGKTWRSIQEPHLEK